MRGWCAGMLVEEHGLDVFDLMQWFDWNSTTTPSHYAKTRERALELKLGINDPPERRKRDDP
jgi:hypothetical protein